MCRSTSLALSIGMTTWLLTLTSQPSHCKLPYMKGAGEKPLKHDLSTCKLDPQLVSEIKGYQDTADKIIEAATAGPFKGRTFRQLQKFVDKFGPRFSGTRSLEDAIDYMLAKMKNEDRLDKAYGEEAEVQHWVRHKECAKLVKTRIQNIGMLGLGPSVGTPPDGITLPALVVRSFEELEAKAAQAKGKIVVFNQPYVSYVESYIYRTKGASRAAKVGAKAVLIRSITPYSIYSPHTGALQYDEGVQKIPAACITVEDAELLWRLQELGEPLEIYLQMLAETLPNARSRNAVGELTGTSLPKERVILSGHIDSWDITNGAMDDGGGCLITTEAVALLRSLNLVPRRTVQAVLFTAEEVGLQGAKAYAKAHKAELGSIVAAFESDSGTFTPRGLDFAGTEEAGCIVNEILKLTKAINTTEYTKYRSVSTDISLLIEDGVPGLSLSNEDAEYFFYHHTRGDALNVQNSEDLDKAMALWAVAAYVTADLSRPLPRSTKSVPSPFGALG